MTASLPEIWIFSRGNLGKISLGPMVRVWEMGALALKKGHRVHLCLDGCTADLPDGMTFHPISTALVNSIPLGSRIVASIFLKPRDLKALLDSRHPFDIDFYCVGALEGLESSDGLPFWRRYQGRRRTAMRYRMLLEYAERVYLSTPEQLTFLGGLLFSGGDKTSCALASRLPEKSILMPMGVREEAFPKGTPNPYPTELRARPIFLWGGGIWAWFDIDTLLRAFALLKARGSNAVLFFLCGSNPSGLPSQDAPVEKALDLAREMELTGRNVFFLDRGASSTELPGYLEHCTAGIMANPARLESFGSWRTRLLDLLWAKKPVLTCGYDPLSERMAAHELGFRTRTADAVELADRIDGFDPEAASGNGIEDLSRLLGWSRTLEPWRKSLDAPFLPRMKRPSRRFWFRYLLGV